MPEMSDLEMTQQLRSLPQFQTLPMIASSASGFNFDRQGRQTCLSLAWMDESRPKSATVASAIEQIPPPKDLQQLYGAARIEDTRGVEEEARLAA